MNHIFQFQGQKEGRALGQMISNMRFVIKQKLSPKEAIECLKDIRNMIDPKSPIHYNRVDIDKGIELFMPGKKDDKHAGDYGLRWNNEYPEHKDIAKRIIQNVNSSSNRYEKSLQWILLLEDVYYNGTLNIEDCLSEGERIAKQVIFWITLQEDINKVDHLGKLRPFCRYAEALATTQPEFEHTYEEVVDRINASSPEFLNEWELPIKPSFYGWSAFKYGVDKPI